MTLQSEHLASLVDDLESGERRRSFPALESLYHLSFERDATGLIADTSRLREAVVGALESLRSLLGEDMPAIASNAWVSLVRLGDRSDALADRLIEQLHVTITDEDACSLVHEASSYLGYFQRREDVPRLLAARARSAAPYVVQDAAMYSLGVHGSPEACWFLRQNQSSSAARVALVAAGKTDFATLELAGRYGHNLYECDACGHVWTDGPLWPDIPPARPDGCERCGAARTNPPLWSTEVASSLEAELGSPRRRLGTDALWFFPGLPEDDQHALQRILDALDVELLVSAGPVNYREPESRAPFAFPCRTFYLLADDAFYCGVRRSWNLDGTHRYQKDPYTVARIFKAPESTYLQLAGGPDIEHIWFTIEILGDDHFERAYRVVAQLRIPTATFDSPMEPEAFPYFLWER